MANPDETTDKMFPPPESGVEEQRWPLKERPLPLQRSIRAEFLLHRLKIEEELAAFRLELGEALARLSPVPTVGGSLRRGAIIAGKGAPIAAAVLALLEVTIPLIRPEWEGPLKALRQAFGAPQ